MVIQIISYNSVTYMLLTQLPRPRAQNYQLVHLPNVSLIFLYKFMESVSFMNSRTTSPWSFSTTRTSSGLAIRLTISNRTCTLQRKLKLNRPVTWKYTHGSAGVSRTLLKGISSTSWDYLTLRFYRHMLTKKLLRTKPADFSLSMNKLSS